MKNRIKSQKGITLVALVITIVILIILATIAINMIFGENGLVNRTEEAKLKQSIAEAQERLELVLADAYAEKNVNKAEYNQDEFLDEFIYEQEPGAKIFEYGEGELISLNGHAFWLDRSVPQLGKYLGEEGILPPVITRINILDKTTSSVNIEVVTTESEGLTYKYSIKELGQGDESYTQVIEKSENTNEFTGLQDTKKYTIKVELIKDGQVADSKIINVLIGKLEKGVVTFGDVLWQEGKASVTIHTEETGYTLQYQIGAIDDNNWIDTTSGSVIEELELNQIVYGRLWNGIEESYPASVDIDDKIAPSATLTVGTKTGNSIAVSVSTSDSQSGLAPSETYKYYLESTLKSTTTNSSYTFSGLTEGASYTLKVIVTDRAGNTTTKSVTASTIKTAQGTLKAGDYVTYPSSKGNLACRVLYDSSSGYGVQLITSSCVKDVTLGYNDPTVSGTDNFTKAKNSYNNAVSTLNNAAEEYNNITYSTRARCVGSHPTSTSDTTSYFTSRYSYMSSYNGQFKNNDTTNYITDCNQMGSLGIRDIDDNYWLASRAVNSSSDNSLIGVRYVNTSCDLYLNPLCGVNSSGSTSAWSDTDGLRPVFTLKSGIKVTGGNGTEESPYTLGV